MASLFLFVLAVLLVNVGGYAQCETGTFSKQISVGKCCGSLQPPEYTNGNPYCKDVDFCKPGTARCEGYTDGQYRYDLVSSTNGTCGNYANEGSCSGWSITCVYQRRCVIGSSSSSSTPNSSSSGPDLPPPPPHFWQCQNAGGPEYGGFGGPYVAKLFRCEGTPGGGDFTCENTRDLAGSCSDWGFCEEGESDCTINTEVHGDPPCGRSGPTFTTSPRCYYACADNTDLSCLPVSTQYVSTATVAGECPSVPPAGCRPVSSSSGAASSGSSSPSSSASPLPPVPVDTAHFTPQNGEDIEIDYSAILNAIRDTLHNANAQRSFLIDIDNAMSLDLSNINKYAQFGYERLGAVASGVSSVGSAVSSINSAVSATSGNVEIIKNSMAGVSTDVEGINNALTSFQENGISLTASTASHISDSKDLLSEINSYLRSDSLYNPRSDTVYNPLLRDIKAAIDSVSINVVDSVGGSAVDSGFARWWSNYLIDNFMQNSIAGRALAAVVSNLSPDSTKSANCAAVSACVAQYGATSGECFERFRSQWRECVEGGTPMDNNLNVAGGILETVFKGLFGSDSIVNLDTVPHDTNVTLPPSYDSARTGILDALRSAFSSDSTASLINRVKAMKDSAEARNRDTVKVQPDSMWLDSSRAAQYARHALITAPTVDECFVCHADLGNFGGLSDTTLKIHVDFANFGGFNFCSIIRAVVRIMTFVVCLSLTLGSWAAAFGYSPKNDA